MLRAIRANAPILLRVLILFSIFVIMIFSYLIFMSKLLSAFPFLNPITRFSTPRSAYIPGLVIFSFLAPLSATVLICLIRLQNVKSISQNLRTLIFHYKWWLMASATAILISFLIPVFSASGHADYPLAVIVVTYVAVGIRKGTMKDRLLSSVVFGYLIGFISDLQSQVFFTGYFGGGGWTDGDFMLPIFLCLGTAVSRYFVEFLEPYTSGKPVPPILSTDYSESNLPKHS